MLRTIIRTAVLLTAVAVPMQALAQVPVPFPRPGQPPPAAPQTPQQPPPATAPGVPAGPAQQQPLAPGEPAPETLGVALYPGSQFIASYDAGRGQRYYLYGVMADYAQIVGYYRTTLRSRGEEVFAEPPVHMFDLARFREETMAFPPSVTVKDYTWGGSQGYLNPKRGAEPVRFRTIIQVVPAPPAAPGR